MWAIISEKLFDNYVHKTEYFRFLADQHESEFNCQEKSIKHEFMIVC